MHSKVIMKNDVVDDRDGSSEKPQGVEMHPYLFRMTTHIAIAIANLRVCCSFPYPLNLSR